MQKFANKLNLLMQVIHFQKKDDDKTLNGKYRLNVLSYVAMYTKCALWNGAK